MDTALRVKRKGKVQAFLMLYAMVRLDYCLFSIHCLELTRLFIVFFFSLMVSHITQADLEMNL